MKIQSNIRTIAEGMEITFQYMDLATVATTDSAGVVFEQYGACEYLGVNMPRNTRIETTEQFLDLVESKEITFSKYSVKSAKIEGEVVILSRHKATTEILKLMFAEAKVIEGNATIDDVKNKNIVGVIPPHLAAEAKTCTSYVIENYNFAVDGDLDMASTLKRGKLMSTISVELVEGNVPTTEKDMELKAMEEYKKTGSVRKIKELIKEVDEDNLEIFTKKRVFGYYNGDFGIYKLNGIDGYFYYINTDGFYQEVGAGHAITIEKCLQEVEEYFDDYSKYLEKYVK